MVSRHEDVRSGQTLTKDPGDFSLPSSRSQWVIVGKGSSPVTVPGSTDFSKGPSTNCHV